MCSYVKWLLKTAASHKISGVGGKKKSNCGVGNKVITSLRTKWWSGCGVAWVVNMSVSYELPNGVGGKIKRLPVEKKSELVVVEGMVKIDKCLSSGRGGLIDCQLRIELYW